jgi:hypothetical protein
MSKPLLAVLIGVSGLTIVVLLSAVAFIAFSLGRQPAAPLPASNIQTADCKTLASSYILQIDEPVGRFIRASTSASISSDTLKAPFLTEMRKAKADFEALPYPACVGPERLVMQRAVLDILDLYSIGSNGVPGADREARALTQIQESLARMRATAQ